MIETLVQVTELDKKTVNKVLDGLASIAYEAVKVDGEALIPYFGKLVKVNRKARVGRNPITGEAINIPAKTVVKFKLIKAVKNAVL